MYIYLYSHGRVHLWRTVVALKAVATPTAAEYYSRTRWILNMAMHRCICWTRQILLNTEFEHPCICWTMRILLNTEFEHCCICWTQRILLNTGYQYLCICWVLDMSTVASLGQGEYWQTAKPLLLYSYVQDFRPPIDNWDFDQICLNTCIMLLHPHLTHSRSKIHGLQPFPLHHYSSTLWRLKQDWSNYHMKVN